MDEMTRRVRAYLIHDAVNNMEGYVADYNADALIAAQESGLTIIAEYNDGSRERVDAADVVEPQPEVNGVTLVQPSYVDDRMVAVVAVFEALANELAAPAVSLMSMEASNRISFAAALENLKELVLHGDAE